MYDSINYHQVRAVGKLTCGKVLEVEVEVVTFDQGVRRC